MFFGMTLYICKLYIRRYNRKDIGMPPKVSGNHVSKTQSTWADLQKARMNEEDNKTKWSPAGIFDDARKNMHMQTNAIYS